MPRASAYVHIPFCRSKCAYCDFSSYEGKERLWDSYTSALVAEIRAGRLAGRSPFRTVYFGGGTPTLLPAAQLGLVLDVLSETFGLAPNAEVSIEANPGTVTRRSLAELRSAGFNRLSLGVQSFDDGLLRRMGRIHTSREAIAAFEAAREAGFSNVGVDLIFGCPGQTLAAWEDDLRRLIELCPEHASLYELTVSEHTPLSEDIRAGRCAACEPDTRVEMLLLGLSMLSEAGYERYEVSNYARPGFRCRHNETYWRNEEYFGFGAGACSYVNGVRSANVRAPEEYVALISRGGSAIDFSETPDESQQLVETLMLALRTTDGLDLGMFARRFGWRLEDAHGGRLAEFQERGWLTISDGRLRPTAEGILLADEIAGQFA